MYIKDRTAQQLGGSFPERVGRHVLAPLELARSSSGMGGSSGWPTAYGRRGQVGLFSGG